ncbi:hypothetical protein DL768_009184 [Monosporascus sp. mg162]|nr:hypothetical protein DL768_009184 [Monosporascus sp. mg162]
MSSVLDGHMYRRGVRTVYGASDLVDALRINIRVSFDNLPDVTDRNPIFDSPKEDGSGTYPPRGSLPAELNSRVFRIGMKSLSLSAGNDDDEDDDDEDEDDRRDDGDGDGDGDDHEDDDGGGGGGGA